MYATPQSVLTLKLSFLRGIVHHFSEKLLIWLRIFPPVTLNAVNSVARLRSTRRYRIRSEARDPHPILHDAHSIGKPNATGKNLEALGRR
jgi:hypothetical protein